MGLWTSGGSYQQQPLNNAPRATWVCKHREGNKCNPNSILAQDLERLQPPQSTLVHPWAQTQDLVLCGGPGQMVRIGGFHLHSIPRVGTFFRKDYIHQSLTWCGPPSELPHTSPITECDTTFIWGQTITLPPPPSPTPLNHLTSPHSPSRTTIGIHGRNPSPPTWMLPDPSTTTSPTPQHSYLPLTC